MSFPVSPIRNRYTWNYLDRIRGHKVLRPPESSENRGTVATACDIANNGETAVVGYREGALHM